MQNLLTFDTGLLVFPNIRVASTFVIKNVIPLRTTLDLMVIFPVNVFSDLAVKRPILQE